MRLVTIKQVAEFLMVKQSTLYSWVHNGSIPFHKLNGLIRFDMDEIESWVKKAAPVQPGLIRSVKILANKDVDTIVKKAIDSVKGKEYNPPNGTPGQHHGLRKEV